MHSEHLNAYNGRMSSEDYKILLDYKSERNATTHSLNRACVLLF